MAKVEIPSFSGLRPSASELRLDSIEAVVASDVTLRRSLLAPRARQTAWSSTNSDPSVPIDGADVPETLFRFRRLSDDLDFWMYWETDVDVAPGPVANVSDGDQRHYYTGDGLPKLFTGESVNDSTPLDGSSPDPKYPYSWFYLGIPAPATKAEVDASEYTPPDTGLSGTIESVTPANMLFVHTYWRSSRSYEAADGVTTIVDPDAIGGAFQILTVGSRIKVATIVDEDNITAEAFDGGGFLAQSPEGDYGYEWGPGGGYSTIIDHSGDHQSVWMFRVPNGATVHIPNHGLAVGDILRATSATIPMVYQGTPTMNILPDGENVTRTLTPSSGTIVFTGSINYVIERGGVVVDPTQVDTTTVEVETRSYVYTYVSHLGEESAPSPPTDPVVIRVGDSVGLDTFEAPPDDHRVITHIRIYRASTGTQGTEFQLVAEVAWTPGLSYVDNVAAAQLGELLPSETWDLPPEDMQGIIALPIGACAGFFDNVLCLSEAGFGHAWPEEYRHYLDFPIVGLSPIGQSTVVLTTGNPYIASGAHPRQFSVRKTDVRHPCLDKRSIVNSGDAVMYASSSGLVRITTQGAANITAGFYTKEAWQYVVGPAQATARKLRGWFFDEQYILHAQYSLNGDDVDHRLIFDFKSGELEITTFTDSIVAGFYDPPAGEFFFIPSANPATIVGSVPASSRPLLRWDYIHPNTNPATGYTTGQWNSRTFAYPQPISPSCARAICKRLRLNGSYNAYGLVRVKIYGVRYGIWDSSSDTLVDETVLVSAADVVIGQPGTGGWDGEHRSDPFRIAVNALFDAMRVEITVAGPVEVESISIAEAMEELMGTPQ